MDLDHGLIRMIGRDQRIAIGCRFAEPRADYEQQVGSPDPLEELRIGPITKIAGPNRALIRNRVLATETTGHRKTPISSAKLWK